MRLWHYELIEALPDSQLVAQWRELNSIYKNQPKHILINYVYDYPKEDLLNYSDIVIAEMLRRGFKVNADNFKIYFAGVDTNTWDTPFKQHHTNRYLLQCFVNLQKKYDRGQKDFTTPVYNELYDIVSLRLGPEFTKNIFYLQ